MGFQPGRPVPASLGANLVQAAHSAEIVFVPFTKSAGAHTYQITGPTNGGVQDTWTGQTSPPPGKLGLTVWNGPVKQLETIDLSRVGTAYKVRVENTAAQVFSVSLDGSSWTALANTEVFESEATVRCIYLRNTAGGTTVNKDNVVITFFVM